MQTLLGQTARDKVTGFSGTVTAFCQQLYGGNRVCLSPPAAGGWQKPRWFPADRVEVTQGENPVRAAAARLVQKGAAPHERI